MFQEKETCQGKEVKEHVRHWEQEMLHLAGARGGKREGMSRNKAGHTDKRWPCRTLVLNSEALYF